MLAGPCSDVMPCWLGRPCLDVTMMMWCHEHVSYLQTIFGRITVYVDLMYCMSNRVKTLLSFHAHLHSYRNDQFFSPFICIATAMINSSPHSCILAIARLFVCRSGCPEAETWRAFTKGDHFEIEWEGLFKAIRPAHWEQGSTGKGGCGYSWHQEVYVVFINEIYILVYLWMKSISWC